MFHHTLRSSRGLGALLGITGVGLAVAEVTTHILSQGRSSEFYHQLTDRVVTPLLRKTCTPEQAHDLAIALAALGPHHRLSNVERRLHMAQALWKDEPTAGIFTNPIGLAAGFDKDGKVIQELLDLGFGFVEIGSVTLQPQPGNPSPRMFRLLPDQGIINRYGFNSLGMQTVKEHLQAFRKQQADKQAGKVSLWQQIFGQSVSSGLVGVNLGKNKTSETPLQDYQTLIVELGPYADYLVINVSSPNTPGLRDLQASSSLSYLLKGCLQARNQLKLSSTPSRSLPPLLVKLAPDLSDDELREVCQVLMQVKIDGIILTNTTTSRANLQSSNKVETGGLSGRPLGARSSACIRQVYRYTDGKIPIIGVGGIFTAVDVYEKLKAGASVVQVYSAMVYEGPGLVSRLRHELAELLVQDGYDDIHQVVGLDHCQNRSGKVLPPPGTAGDASLGDNSKTEPTRRLLWWA